MSSNIWNKVDKNALAAKGFDLRIGSNLQEQNSNSINKEKTVQNSNNFSSLQVNKNSSSEEAQILKDEETENDIVFIDPAVYNHSKPAQVQSNEENKNNVYQSLTQGGNYWH